MSSVLEDWDKLTSASFSAQVCDSRLSSSNDQCSLSIQCHLQNVDRHFVSFIVFLILVTGVFGAHSFLAIAGNSALLEPQETDMVSPNRRSHPRVRSRPLAAGPPFRPLCGLP